MKKVIIYFLLIAIIIIWIISYYWYRIYTRPELKDIQSNPSIVNTDIQWLPKVLETKEVKLNSWDSYELVISRVVNTINGLDVVQYAFNWMVPWPRLVVQKGASINLKVTNTVPELKVSLHSHGIRGSYIYDWVIKEMWGSQDPILNGQSYEYKIDFPDEGVFWYHPHIQEQVQQPLWLFWLFVVQEREPEQYVNQKFIVLHDILANKNGYMDTDIENVNYALMGKYGNILLSNNTNDLKMDFDAQDWLSRLSFLNASSARPYKLSIPWAKIKLVSSDQSKYTQQQFVDEVVIWPSERYTVDVWFEESWKYSILHSTPQKSYVVWTINFVKNEQSKEQLKQQFETLHTNDELLAMSGELLSYINMPFDKSISFDLQMYWWMDHSMHMNMWSNKPEPIEWEDAMPWMNSDSNQNTLQWQIIDDRTKKINSDINWEFSSGSLVKIRIQNPSNIMHPMQHPFHMHGQRFVVLSTNWIPTRNLVWKDTVLVPAGSTTEILVDMSNPWKWMSHCHISEHGMAWMMFHFSVK